MTRPSASEEVSATRVVAVANQKGGVGKTTTAINLATCLADQGQQVLLVDLDPQGNATSGLGLDKEEGRSAYYALLGQRRLDASILDTGIQGLSLIPAEPNLAGVEVEIARSDRYLERLTRILAPVVASGEFDIILLDCPPSLGILVMNALAAADTLLIPIQCEYYALEGLSMIVQLVERIRRNGTNPRLRIEGIVMTMYDSRTRLARQVVDEVKKHFGDLVFETLIPRSIRLTEAPGFGIPAVTYDNRCTGALAYVQLAEEFLNRQRPAQPETEAEETDALEETQAVGDADTSDTGPIIAPIGVPR